MRTKKIIRTLTIFLVLTVNISCDQISKKIVRQQVDYHEAISIVGDHVTLIKVENTGAFLSIGNALPQPLKLILLTILPLLVLLAGLWYVLTNHHLSGATILGVCFVVGGGIGNLYDRIIFGSVTDFLHIDFVLFQTGIFNMADVSIMTGLTLLMGLYIMHRASVLHSEKEFEK